MDIKLFKGFVKVPSLGIYETRTWLEEPYKDHVENFKFHFGLDEDERDIKVFITNIEEVAADFDTMFDLWIKDQLPIWVEDALKHKASFLSDPESIVTRAVKDCCRCYFDIACSSLSDSNYNKLVQACANFAKDYCLKTYFGIMNLLRED